MRTRGSVEALQSVLQKKPSSEPISPYRINKKGPIKKEEEEEEEEEEFT
jgi:hypothetical protein